MFPERTIRKDLKSIFQAGLDRVNPYSIVTNCVTLREEKLHVSTEDISVDVDLSEYSSILLIGAGKASAPMARAFEDILGNRITDGLICVKEGHSDQLTRSKIIEASHPIPNQSGLNAAQLMMVLARNAGPRTLVINCISGGGSALLPCPLTVDQMALCLEDKQATTNALLRCGATIQEINCVRKHISGIKGGRLLQLLAPARSLNFILSDVIGDDLSSIASGMTSFDLTTFADALEILKRYDLIRNVPAPVIKILELGSNGQISETLKPGDDALRYTNNILVGTNRQSLLAAGAKAQDLGYNVKLLSSQICGEARHIGRFLADVAKDMVASDMFLTKPACVIVGGESVVTMQGNGKGGRNQEMALAFLAAMHSWRKGKARVGFLAASTDGNDGPTDAAGAFADINVIDHDNTASAAITKALDNNDAYTFFDAVDGLLKTGPTNTNVCDIQILVVV